MGVKNGFKDVGRVLDIDFGDINQLNKKIDTWVNIPTLKFKHLDELQETNKSAWKELEAYKEKYPELFRLTRRFEGTPRNIGIHASGILVTPMPVNNLFPTRMKDGTIVTLYTGSQLEDFRAIKLDILGLKTLSVIKNTLDAIDSDFTFDKLYDMVDIEDPKIYKQIQMKKTEGLFQIESNMFKGMIDEMQPSSFNDIVALTALG